MENIYSKKYIKYKNKYLNLKNQLAGSPNGKFKYSLDKGKEYYLGHMFDKIDEFETQTKAGYSSSSIRLVNEVEMMQNDNIINFFITGSKRNKEKTQILLTDEINEYINKKDWKDYFLYIARFNNFTTTYDKGSLDNGINVLSSKLEDIFKDTFRESEEYKSHLNKDNGDYIGAHRKGFGNDNLLCILKEIKKQKPNLKVLYLHANGDENLVGYYQSIGFTTLIENTIPILNSADKPIGIYEYIMFGMYDEIIENLEKKSKSDCSKLMQ